MNSNPFPITYNNTIPNKPQAWSPIIPLIILVLSPCFLYNETRYPVTDARIPASFAADHLHGTQKGKL